MPKHKEFCDRVIDDCRGVLGWQVRHDGDRVFLVTGGGIAGVRLPVACAAQVVRRLKGWDALGPVIGVPGATPTWVVLTDADDTAVIAGIGLGSGFLFAGQEIPLPPSVLEHGRARWIEPPDTARRWLPSCGAVLAALRGPRENRCT